jgi:peptidoglycan hydrolase-like protein with peptidoglycan-binding domain
MRISLRYIVLSIFILSYAPYVSAQTNTSNPFATNLSLGFVGDQVITLQEILNRDSTTRIASTGPGSPGNETRYFGTLTKAAVIRFQERYTTDVLAPVGLTQGNGFVGAYTRAKLNTLSVVPTDTVTNTTLTTPSSPLSVVSDISTPSLTPISATSPQNPNLQNIDLYIAAVKREGQKEGMSSSTLALIEDKIRIGAATTTDFRQQFFDEQQTLYMKKISADTVQSPLLAFFEKAFSFVTMPFVIEKAYAAMGLPFGGRITYVNPAICNCSPGVTQLFVALPSANPSQSNLLLDYIAGTEAFSFYNLPTPSVAALGAYVPTPGSCWLFIVDGCIPMPSEGEITPQTGSSLSPG